MTSTAVAEGARDGWLDPHAAGKHIDIHPEQVRRLCREGKLHHRRMGDGPCAPYRFKAWWLDAYVEGRPAADVAAEEERRSGRHAGPRRGRKRAPAGTAA